jgi:hypothetical protein
MHEHAQIAIRAAQLRPTIGHWAAWRMIQRAGCPARLYTLARVLHASKTANL